MPAMRPPQALRAPWWYKSLPQWLFGDVPGNRAGSSKIPTLSVGDQEIAEHLDARDRLELLRIDEVDVESHRVEVAEQLDQAAVVLDQIVGQARDPQPALAGAQQSEHVVDHEPRLAPALAVARRLGQPAHVLQILRRIAAEHHDAMVVEILVHAWRA